MFARERIDASRYTPRGGAGSLSPPAGREPERGVWQEIGSPSSPRPSPPHGCGGEGEEARGNAPAQRAKNFVSHPFNWRWIGFGDGPRRWTSRGGESRIGHGTTRS